VADHYQYVACIGLLALAAAGVVRALEVFKNRWWFLKPVFCGALLLALGVLTWRQSGTYVDAETLWRTTLARNPGSWMAHNGLGMLLVQKGEVDEAIVQFQQAIRTGADNPEARDNLGNALFQKGRRDQAIIQYRWAVESDPGSALAHSNLGNALLYQGQVGQAMVHYRAAVKLEPDNGFFLNNLAWLLAASPQPSFRNGQEAVQLAERACQLTGYQQPQLISTLAAAYAQAGRFDDAVAAGQKARDLALALGQQMLAHQDEQLLQLFKARQALP